MKNIGKYWPAILALIVGFLNTDLVVIPFLRSMDIGTQYLSVICCPFSTAELAYWYWFWGWFGKLLISTKIVSDDIAFSKEKILADIRAGGAFNQIMHYFVEKYRWLVRDDHRVIRWIKRGGHASLFAIGFLPEPGSRMIGLILCRSLHFKKGFYSLAAGNFLHILYIIGGWNLVFSIFGL